MKISKNELKKISRKLRKISSDVINAYYSEQNGFLNELIVYINNTQLLKNYIDSIEYDVGNLESDITEINGSYGRKTLYLGSDSKKRAFLLYKAFIIITENNYPTYNFGWYYAGGNKYQDMAKAFGDRLVYPFVSELGEYMKDIVTDMGYDESNALYNINVNSSGVQVNIAEKNSSISASQVNNWATQEVVDKMLENFKETYPNLKIVGARNGYFTDEELKGIEADIAEKNPDIVYIGITSPKKEYIVQEFLDNGLNSVFMGVGGSFDVLSGTIPRAPKWMQKANLEWLFRVANEPRRLFKRYFVGNVTFIKEIVKEKRSNNG